MVKRVAYFLLFLILIPLFFISCGANKAAEVRPDPADLRIYQVMVESFIDGGSTADYGVGYGPSHHRGDLKGIIKALPYIKSLGMNAVWLTPIFDSGRGIPLKGEGSEPDLRLDATGYFAHDYFNIDPGFGTLQDAQELVKKAHEMGIYVILDGVFGHSKKNVMPSPAGKLPVGNNFAYDYPASLPFFKEVVLYWIDKLEIDGWRIDQAYQIPPSCLRELRETVEKKCEERRQQGKKWGIAGFMVGEIWDVADSIAVKGYGTEESPALLSCFDFPVRYKLVQVLAVEEKGFGRQPVSVLNEGMETHRKYPDFALPVLMLTNHDLVRFGDLIERAGYEGKESASYWSRHQLALSFLAAYSGPIVIYYGDEYGAEVPGFAAQISDPEEKCWEKGLCDDHVSRTSGKIIGFTPSEERLIEFTSRLMRIREQNPALWKGERKNLTASDGIYADYKVWRNNRIVLVMNVNEFAKNIKIKTGAKDIDQAVDLLSGKEIACQNGDLLINLPGLGVGLIALGK